MIDMSSMDALTSAVSEAEVWIYLIANLTRRGRTNILEVVDCL
jgi:hypothetical protein